MKLKSNKKYKDIIYETFDNLTDKVENINALINTSFYIEYIHLETKKIDKQIESITNNKQDSNLTKERFLVLVRQGLDKIDECVKLCDSDDNHCLRECYRDLTNLKNKISHIKNSTKSWKPYYLPCVQELLDDESIKYLQNLNKEISKLTSYGVREELAEQDSIELYWSNDTQKWFPTPKIIKKGEQVRLDANQLLTPYDKIFGHDKIGHAVSCANPLPLYSLSLEAKDSGQSPFIESTLMWAKLQLEANKRKEEQEKFM